MKIQKEVKMNIELVHSPISWDQLPSNSIALDGAVRGCRLDLKNNRWSFDHHAEDQPSLSTRSTAMQTLLALRAGLDVSRIENVLVSSIDADSVTATALVLKPELSRNEEVVKYIAMYLDTVDSMGPCGALQNDPMSFHYSLKAGFKEELTTMLLKDRIDLFMELVDQDELLVPSMEPRKNPCTLVAIDNDGTLLGIEEGEFSFGDLYSRSNIGILYSPLRVTIGAKSSFVTDKHFLLDGLFNRLNRVEVAKGAEVDENGKIVNGWGGKDLVGGSPFKGETLLTVEEVINIVTSFLKG